MSKITVLHPIEVPEGKYCWKHLPPFETCEHFDDGRHSRCGLGFTLTTETKIGVIKADECMELKQCQE